MRSCLQTACRRLALLRDLWLFHFNLANGAAAGPQALRGTSSQPLGNGGP